MSEAAPGVETAAEPTPTQVPDRIPPLGWFLWAWVIASSAAIVWILNASIWWPVQVGLIGFVVLLAVTACGLAGIETVNICMMLAVYSMPVEGLILGGHWYGWPGAVAGVLLGLVLAVPMGLLLTALLTLLVVVMGG